MRLSRRALRGGIVLLAPASSEATHPIFLTLLILSILFLFTELQRRIFFA
jgi:hypothetical protein